MVKLIVLTVTIICINVCWAKDYLSLFESEEEITTEFDEIVRRPTARLTTVYSTARTTRKYSQPKSNAARTTPEPEIFITTSETHPAVQPLGNRAIWEHGKNCEGIKKCVSMYLCNKEGSVIVDGSLIIDERLDLETNNIPVCPTLQMCCEKYNSLPEKPILCSSFSAPSQCGVRNQNGLGGKAKSKQGNVDYAQYAEFPWMMAVMNETSLYGGGSLIHPRIVVTAAHIVTDVDYKIIRVRGGEYNTQTTDEICSHVDRKVKNILRHENFQRSSLINNLALLVLEKEFKMTATINTICLPPADMDFKDVTCISSGWGQLNFQAKDRYQAFLKKVQLPVVSNERCEDMLRNTRLGEDFILDDKLLCAGGEEGIDSCTGDGGSPLVCPSLIGQNEYVLAGVVSGGIGCGTKDVPGLYTDIAKNRDWIDSKLKSFGISTDNVEPRRS